MSIINQKKKTFFIKSLAIKKEIFAQKISKYLLLIHSKNEKKYCSKQVWFESLLEKLFLKSWPSIFLQILYTNIVNFYTALYCFAFANDIHLYTLFQNQNIFSVFYCSVSKYISLSSLKYTNFVYATHVCKRVGLYFHIHYHLWAKVDIF